MLLQSKNCNKKQDFEDKNKKKHRAPFPKNEPFGELI